MLTKDQYLEAQRRAGYYFSKANIVITPEEAKKIEVADFGFGSLDVEGLELLVYINTERVCAKELVLFPGQTCPEHFHPDFLTEYLKMEDGKEETFRCRYGVVFLYVPGEPALEIAAKIPLGKEDFYTVRNQIILHPGDQYTLKPNTKHWFQAGPDGAVVSEFSTTSRDEKDVFSDPNVKRKTETSAPIKFCFC